MESVPVRPPTYNCSMYSKPIRLVPITLLAALILGGCADGVNWSERERRNGEKLLASLAAVSDAARIANAADSERRLARNRDELLAQLRRAHLLASQVDDIVLEKLHPRMYSQFRLRYQRAVASMIEAYEDGDIDEAEKAAADIQDFMTWFRANRHTFRWWDESLE